MITIINYNQEFKFKTRKEALAFFTEGMAACDAGSSEYSRYAYIVMQLEEGKTVMNDKYWEE